METAEIIAFYMKRARNNLPVFTCTLSYVHPLIPGYLPTPVGDLPDGV